MRPFLVLLLFPLFSYAQDLPRDSVTGKYTYQGIVNADSIPKSVLYSRAKEWIALTYKSAPDVINLDDKEAGRIICKGYFPVTVSNFMGSYPYLMAHVMIIEIKEGKYRYKITDFVMKTTTGQTASPATLEEEWKMGNKIKEDLKRQVDSNCRGIILSLQKAMTTPPAKDEW